LLERTVGTFRRVNATLRARPAGFEPATRGLEVRIDKFTAVRRCPETRISKLNRRTTHLSSFTHVQARCRQTVVNSRPPTTLREPSGRPGTPCPNLPPPSKPSTKMRPRRGRSDGGGDASPRSLEGPPGKLGTPPQGSRCSWPTNGWRRRGRVPERRARLALAYYLVANPMPSHPRFALRSLYPHLLPAGVGPYPLARYCRSRLRVASPRSANNLRSGYLATSRCYKPPPADMGVEAAGKLV
jgi:hypothetical protein